MKSKIYFERETTCKLLNGNYKLYPESVVFSVQVEIVYLLSNKQINNKIKGIINNVYNKIEPTKEDFIYLYEYQQKAQRIYENFSTEQKELANNIGTFKFTELSIF